MSEPNPYEPPQLPESPSQLRVVRGGFSVAAILVMSPFIAMIAGCGGFWLTMEAMFSLGTAPGYYDGTLMLVAMAVFAFTLAGMLRWAWRAHHRHTR